MKSAAKRLVELAVVANRAVLVALVVVELRAVKLRRVVEPVIKRFESVVSPAVTPRVPGKV